MLILIYISFPDMQATVNGGRLWGRSPGDMDGKLYSA